MSKKITHGKYVHREAIEGVSIVCVVFLQEQPLLGYGKMNASRRWATFEI
jgi:hypothetical protein